MKAKMSDSYVKGLKAGDETQEIYDQLTPGLVLRVTSSGTKSWSLRYRVRGNKRLERFTIGEYPHVGLAKAREEATEARNKARAGVDPNNERKKAKQDAETQQAAAVLTTCRRISERYLRLKEGTPSYRNYVTCFDRHILPVIGDMQINAVRRAHVAEITTSVLAAGHGDQANKCLAIVKSMFSWCCDQGLLEFNPVAGMKQPKRYIPKERALSDTEIVKFWKALPNAPMPTAFVAIFRLILVTGQRPGEVAQMRREELDIEQAVWVIPRERMKAGKEQVVPLSPLAVALLKPALEAKGRSSLVFQGPINPNAYPANVVSGAAVAAQSTVGLPKWTPHDLRRSCLTGLGRLGIEESIIGRVGAHAQVSITARVYNRHNYLNEKREALNRWAAHIEGLLGGGADIVHLGDYRKAG